MKNIYMDNNATTMAAPEVVQEMMPFFAEYYANPSSMHFFAGEVGKKVDFARQKIAALINADPVEIVITSCGTESDNTAIRGVLEANPEKKHIVTTRVEHPAVLNLCRYLSKRGYAVTELSVNHEGLLDVSELRNSLRDDTAIVSVMYANNETGVIFPVEEIGKIVKERGIPFHVDAVQAAGKIPLNMKTSTIDLLSISGHKLHAPKGIGMLYVRRGIKLRPFIIGGHQEFGRRAGTENVPYIIGLGKACELADQGMKDENIRVKKLRDKLENFILDNIKDTNRNGHIVMRLPNTSNVSFRHIEGEAILLSMSYLGISASSGSACTSGSLQPSHVLHAMGVPFDTVHGSIRFSLSRYNTEDEINYIIENLPAVINRLRELSPFGKEGRTQSGV